MEDAVCIKQISSRPRGSSSGLPPTGLVTITRLNPSSRTLHSASSQILEEFMGLAFDRERQVTLFSTYPTVNTGGFDGKRITELLKTWREGARA